MSPAERKADLGAILEATRALWQAQPFKIERPDWCASHPALCAALLQLSDSDSAALNHDAERALDWLLPWLPEIGALPALGALPRLPQLAALPLSDPGAFWSWEIPGRKRAQIEAFAASTQEAQAPVLDWCAGKGHLGRLLALCWQQAVTSLELDAELCAAGRALAQRAGVAQRFVHADALQSTSCMHGQHVVALHACGPLHRAVIREAGAAGAQAIDLAPCCYMRGVADRYLPLAGQSPLSLRADDVRLAVTETVTASPRLTRARDREMAWKLAFVSYRAEISGSYQPFRPIPAPWLRLSFADFITRLAEREKLPRPEARTLPRLEAVGWRRQGEVMRLSILRHTFRRALELYLVSDLALALENQGYAVRLGTFCPRELTPRNLLISARG